MARFGMRVSRRKPEASEQTRRIRPEVCARASAVIIMLLCVGSSGKIQRQAWARPRHAGPSPAPLAILPSLQSLGSAFHITLVLYSVTPDPGKWARQYYPGFTGEKTDTDTIITTKPMLGMRQTLRRDTSQYVRLWRRRSFLHSILRQVSVI
ncbi:hypothetical protein BC834DRAFT_468367 [Gloeopeniophorella convolvens]|nr:hypothetical protein BC834DRAFT_468367 [Gloeopeniophorella convolvens]